MHTRLIRDVLIRSTFIAISFITFYSIAFGSFTPFTSPVPIETDDLELVVHDSGAFKYEYHRGYTMEVFNTEAFGEPLAAEEEMAYLNSCKNNTPVAPGEVRIYQTSYSAQDQDGNSIQLKCERMPVSEVWLQTFLEALPQCIAESTAAVGWKMPASVVVHSVMIYMHKGSNGKLSLHAPARAVDISKLELIDSKGSQNVVVSLANQANNPIDDTTTERKFLRAFRGCWSDTLVDRYACSNWNKQNFRGSVGWEDSAHQNHLHLSRPFCPDNADIKGG